jgi:hypothetical protein
LPECPEVAGSGNQSVEFAEIRSNLTIRPLLVPGCVMSEFLPQDVRAGLEEARKSRLGRKSRLRVTAGDETFHILRFWEDGFSLDADMATHLRGLVDIYDGSRHLYQSLIVASEVEGGELICVMKRSTAALDRAPLDFVRDDTAPVGLLPRL